MEMIKTELGLAVGAVPGVSDEHGKGKIVEIGFHCKTIDDPANLLGGSDKRGVLRPSPLQLQRNADGSLKSYAERRGTPVNTLVAVDGVQEGPIRIGFYNPLLCIPLCINADPTTGNRMEEVFLFKVDSLKHARSVFPDGGYVTVKFKKGKAWVEKVEIPLDLLLAWRQGDDSAPCNHLLNLEISDERAVNFTVPVATLVLFLLGAGT